VVSEISTLLSKYSRNDNGRGLNINHTTIYRWVVEYAPKLNRYLIKHLKQTGYSWRVDETYLKINGKWMYLYRGLYLLLQFIYEAVLTTVTK